MPFNFEVDFIVALIYFFNIGEKKLQNEIAKS